MLIEVLMIYENSECIDFYYFSEEYPNFIVNSGIFLSFLMEKTSYRIIL